MARPARWERCLARAGAQLLPLPASPGRLGVFPGGDRRRRPLAKLDQVETHAAISAGRLEIAAGGYRQTEAGRLAIKRLGSGFEHQHRVLAIREIIDRDGRVSQAVTNKREGPVARWSHFLDAEQINAAEQFLRDYHSSTLSQPVTRNWSLDALARSGGRGNAQEQASLQRLAATQRVMSILDRLETIDRDILCAALIREESLAALGRRFAGNGRKGAEVVRRTFSRVMAVTNPRPPSGCA